LTFILVLHARTKEYPALRVSYKDKNKNATLDKSKVLTPFLFLPGDRVALENGIPCSQASCTPCRTGHYHGCPDMVFFSSPPVHGTLRRYHAHPAAWLHKLPDDMSFEEGAMLEPLSVALAGIERAGLRLGDPLVICGAGPIGLVSLLAAHAAGAAPLVITDLDESRLEMASRLVPRVRTVRVEGEVGPEGVAEEIKRALGREAGLVLECTGVESSIHSAIYVGWMCEIVDTVEVADKQHRRLASAAQCSSSVSERVSRRFRSCMLRSARSTSGSNSGTTRLIQRRSRWCRRA
jgi:NADPH:quinone reductase-like Zn-dependent oxidoreductase